MNVLVIGNGGREHAVVQALKKSPKVDKIYAMKGNAGIAEIAECVNVDYCDVKAVGDWVDAHPDVAFTVVTPDDKEHVFARRDISRIRTVYFED